MSKEITHDGVVVRIDGRDVSVMIIQTSACSGCHAKGACMASDKDEKIIVADAAGQTFHPGDQVTLVGSNSMAWSALAYAFVIPTVLAMAVLFTAASFMGEGAAALAVLVFLALYYFVLWLFRDKMKTTFSFRVEPKRPSYGAE